ncbi:hypothetical protein ACFHWD_18625 [Clostridium sp. MT-14]|uniref:hypothetical protein n=1 Tax=unclassified Clostridium TaxID=2614128 RepID=UPI0012394B1A|nr:hypothetical protein [Clostridium sp. HV4-5-A1G]KAA8668983.1 hypothetical protein F3O63_13705 [Clostridium sp. HV4-5-A1G]CAB1249642.1 hypothetical protein CLOSBL3_11920 [Clostridiaceae bacterium BL-3]
MMKELDSKGFVFLDILSRPYRCAIKKDEAWLFYWNKIQKVWISLRPLSQQEVVNFQKPELPKRKQEMYFK